MISFCVMSINAKNELRTFVEFLHYYNPGVDFEVCLCHDNRVNDGSPEWIRALQQEYPLLKVIENTKNDTIKYLDRLLDWYDSLDKFPADLRECLRNNLNLYAKDETLLYDIKRSYLWTSLGHLYNKAANIATGDILIFTPADYIWTCNLRQLEQYVIHHRREGLFYGKFAGLMHGISNELAGLNNLLDQQIDSSLMINREYRVYPSKPEAHYIVNPKTRRACGLTTLDYHDFFMDMCRQYKGTGRYADMHHGTHIMTRKAWDIIGGFTEEFYGRAWPDDKMNAHAMRLFWANASMLPMEFAFHFIHMAMWRGGILKEKDYPVQDQWIDQHPIQGKEYYQTYLHNGYVNQEYSTKINQFLDVEFACGSLRGREAPILRLS